MEGATNQWNTRHVGVLSQLSADLKIPFEKVKAVYSAEFNRLEAEGHVESVLGILALRNTCLLLRDRVRS